jgi:hypothetical protein
MKKIITKWTLFIVILGSTYYCSLAQQMDTSSLNYSKLYGLALNASIQEILIKLDKSMSLSEKDKKFKDNFEARFKFSSDRTNYFSRKDTSLNPLLRIYQDYWRKSMLDNNRNFDKYFAKRIIAFFKSENSKEKFTSEKISRRTVIKSVYKEYIHSKGFYTNDIGKTGKLFDLLVWKNETDTTFNIFLIDDTAKVKICMMKVFYSLVW